MNKAVNSVIHFLRSNSPLILTGGAVIGTIATAVLTGKASYESALDIQREFGPDASNKAKVKYVWKRYIPAGVTGVATVACVVGSNRVSSRRIVAATMAYSVTEQAFSKYKEKIVEQIGKTKEQTVRDELAADRMRSAPLPSNVIITGPGVLCCELYTGRYFTSDMETLKRSENMLNDRLLKHDYCSLDRFYELINIQPTQYSNDLGWVSGRLMELEFSTIMSEDGRPCLAFSYNYVRPID